MSAKRQKVESNEKWNSLQPFAQNLVNEYVFAPMESFLIPSLIDVVWEYWNQCPYEVYDLETLQLRDADSNAILTDSTMNKAETIQFSLDGFQTWKEVDTCSRFLSPSNELSVSINEKIWDRRVKFQHCKRAVVAHTGLASAQTEFQMEPWAFRKMFIDADRLIVVCRTKIDIWGNGRTLASHHHSRDMLVL